MASKTYTLLEYLVTIEMELKKLKKIVAESVGADYSELIANIDGIRNELNTFKTSITGTVDTNNTNLITKFNSLEQQFNTFKTNISNTVNSNKTEITSQVNTLNTNFNDFKTSIESQVSSLNTRVTSVERRVTTLENSGGSSGGSVDLTEVNSRISTNENNITTLQSDVSSLKGRVTTLENNGGSGGSGGSVNINDNTISNNSTWSSAKIEDFVHTNDNVIWSNIQGKNLSVEFTKEGYLREVEIWGNTVQNSENLNDIRHLGKEVDGKYKIEVESKSEDGSKTYKNTILLPYKLRKVNDVSDRLYWDSLKKKYVIEKNIIDVTFNNNSGWSVWYHSSPILRFMKTLSDIPVSSTSLQVISNKVPSIGYNINQKNIYINNGKLYLILNETDLSSADLAGLNTWLSNEPLTVYYQLASPQIIETTITEQTNQPTYKDKTLFTVTGGIDGIIKAKAPLDGGQAIQSLTEVNNTQDKLIDTTMLATDELYTMVEPILEAIPQTMTLERSTSKMVDMYVCMIQRGLKTIEQVPARYREEVKRILTELEK